MDYNNNNNIALADQLSDIASRLSKQETDLSASLKAIGDELTQLDLVAQKMDAPSLRAIAHWLILNIEQNDDNATTLKTLISSGNYYNWLEILSSLLQNYEQTLLPDLYKALTSPSWPVKPSIPLLKDLAQWIDECKHPEVEYEEELPVVCVKNNQIERNNGKSIEISDAEQTHVFEEVDIDILEKEYITPDSDIPKEYQEDITEDLPLVITEKTSSYDELESSDHEDEHCIIFSGELAIDDNSQVNSESEALVALDEIYLPEETNESSSEYDSESLNETANDEFSNEVEDIIMTLTSASGSAEDVFENTEYFIAELQRLNMLASINNYPAIADTSDWCQSNINLFAQNQSDENKQFIYSGECWSWLELVILCLNEPEEASNFAALSSELNRSEWPNKIETNDLQKLLLFLKDQENIDSTNSELSEDTEKSDENSQNEIISETTIDSQHTLKWNEDIHPELLSAYFHETPSLVNQLTALLLDISNENTNKEGLKEASRSAHTIKGGSAVVGITALSNFTGKLEEILDYARDHELPKDILTLLADSSSCLESLFKAVQEEGSEPEELSPILAKLATYIETFDEIDSIDELLDLDTIELPDFIKNQETNDSIQKLSNEDNNDEVIESDNLDIEETDNTINNNDSEDSIKASNQNNKDESPTDLVVSNDAHDFCIEVDDIVMTLSTYSSKNTEESIGELQRLDLLAEVSGYPEVSKISHWCQDNLTSFNDNPSDKTQLFIDSGECWSWVELISASISDPEEISHLSSLSMELMRDEWIEPLELESLQNLLLRLKMPAENNDIVDDEDTLSNTNESIDKSNYSLSWDDDIHPELLEVYLEETPGQVIEIKALIKKISKGKADKDERHTAARVAHTIKGASAVVGVTALSEFAYKLEEILDYSVKHELPEDILNLLKDSSTCLENLFEAVKEKQTEPKEFSQILAKLTTYAETLDEDDDFSLDLTMPALPDFIKQQADTSNDTADSIQDEKIISDNDLIDSSEAVEGTRDTLEIVTNEQFETNNTNDAEETEELPKGTSEAPNLSKSEKLNEISEFSVELDDITMSLYSILNTPEAVLNQTADYISELQRLELLADISGYPEVSKTSQWCQRNVSLFSQDPTNEKNRQFILTGECWSWIELISAVLMDPEEISHLSMLSIELMRDEWIEALPIEDLQALLLSLKKADQEESISEIKTEFTENKNSSQSLSWDDDIHPELLSVYLQETPDQVSEVAVLLHKISKGKASKADHQQAARIAHTIKGASGVVGINALVDFTHKLEDILDYSVNNKLPEEVSDLLAESSDCLEDLFEAVQKNQAEPKEFAPILEKLTHYSQLLSQNEKVDDSLFVLESADFPDFIKNKKSTESKKSSSLSKEPDFSALVSTDENNSLQAGNTETATAETHIRVPIKVIDKLLNLAGELVTTSTQVSDKISDTLLTSSQVRTQDKQVHKMLNELSETILKQEKDQFNLLSNLKNSDFDNLEMDTYNELHSITGLLTESILDSEEIEANIVNQLNELNDYLRSLDRLNKELSEVILSSRMVSINSMIPRLERIVRQTCRKTNKKAELTVKGNEINVDTDILNGLADPLLHLLRNAVDHGIESSEDRKTNKKPATGDIKLEFSRQGNHIQLQLKDDGAGIDPEKIYKNALRKELITKDQKLSKDEKLQLILKAGFTTQDSITDISGRGVGMDVVKNAVELLKGTLTIESEIGEGTTFTIKIPLTLVTSATILVSISNYKVAIPSDSIEQLYYLSPEMILERKDGNYMLHDGKEIPIQSLAAILNWEEKAQDFSTSNTLLLVKGTKETHAIYIDEIIHSREVVIKSLSAWLDSSKGLIGACHLPDGGVAPVINLPQLLSLNENTNKAIKRIQDESSDALTFIARTQQILVVDDSLSNRKALSLIINQTEYDVITAVDGLDALQIMNENIIDMVFTDLEMPRMNGLELTQAIRAWDDKKETPVVMITSRTTTKHRELAEKAGVDGYLTKPVVTETLLDSINHWLKEASLEEVIN